MTILELRERTRLGRLPQNAASDAGRAPAADVRAALRAALVQPPESQGNLSRGYLAAKRAMDIVGALGIALILSPVMVATYVILSMTTGGGALIRQTRIGRHGKPFAMYKFRTMRATLPGEETRIENHLTAPVFKNRRDPRITLVGNILRRLSIDEMPQLWNVLRGEMSLVGPRPALQREVDQYDDWQRGRLAVKPGLTGLWQVSGRCDITDFDEWVRLDLLYIRRQSLALDFALLCRTPWCVLSCRGAY